MTELFTAPCVACGRPIRVERVGAEVRMLERHGRTWRKHRCPKR